MVAPNPLAAPVTSTRRAEKSRYWLRDIAAFLICGIRFGASPSDVRRLAVRIAARDKHVGGGNDAGEWTS